MTYSCFTADFANRSLVNIEALVAVRKSSTLREARVNFQLAVITLLCVWNTLIVVNVAFASFIVLDFILRLFVTWLWIEEKVCVCVSVVFNFRLSWIAVQKGEIVVCTGCKAFCAAGAVV